MYICKQVKNDIIFSERRKMVDGKSLTSASKVEEESFSSPPPGLFCEKLFHFRCVDKIPCHIFFSLFKYICIFYKYTLLSLCV